MERFEFPEEFSNLPDDELAELETQAVDALRAALGTNSVVDEDRQYMRGVLRDGIKEIRAEKATRREKAEATVAEMDELAAEVFSTERDKGPVSVRACS